MIPAGARVYIAMGNTGICKGCGALRFWQQSLSRNPHGGDLFVFRGWAGALIKIIWPSAKDGIVSLTAAQLAYLLEGIDWRNPHH